MASQFMEWDLVISNFDVIEKDEQKLEKMCKSCEEENRYRLLLNNEKTKATV